MSSWKDRYLNTRTRSSNGSAYMGPGETGPEFEVSGDAARLTDSVAGFLYGMADLNGMDDDEDPAFVIFGSLWFGIEPLRV